MRGLVSVMLVMVSLSLFSFMALSVNKEYDEFKESSAVFEFNTFTSAVCDYSGNDVTCKDELFVNCNGKISKAGEIAECNGIILDRFKVTGSAVFEKGWKDTRI
ncbi:hypothetical protein HYX06_03610 [Candidatus Woesearchaeota archaeon]|nr:hypothetical protein [Candidatus Woesearchaeota archaeon]